MLKYLIGSGLITFSLLAITIKTGEIKLCFFCGPSQTEVSRGGGVTPFDVDSECRRVMKMMDENALRELQDRNSGTAVGVCATSRLDELRRYGSQRTTRAPATPATPTRRCVIFNNRQICE